MEYGKPMREETIQPNEDGSFTVKGGGWYWARFNTKGHIVEMADGMLEKKSHRGWLMQARLTLEKFGKIPVLR